MAVQAEFQDVVEDGFASVFKQWGCRWNKRMMLESSYVGIRDNVIDKCWVKVNINTGKVRQKKH